MVKQSAFFNIFLSGPDLVDIERHVKTPESNSLYKHDIQTTSMLV